MRYRILGSLKVLGPDGQPHSFERRHSRILAVLLLSPNQVVSRDYLIDAVWDETPPATAGRQLQNCISNLRAQLPGAGGWKHVIAAEPAGYRIHLGTGQLDAQVFEAAVASAQQHQAAGHIADAATQLREALALWDGPALAGMTGRAIEAASARLNEHRLTALEDCLELELRQGRCHQNVPELIELVAAHPLRERMVGLLMQALHGSGRQSEALQAYDRKLCAEISAVVLRNRGAGPFGLLNLLDERCGGVFEDIDAVIPPQERDEFMSRYRAAAGLAKDKLNGSPSIIPPGVRVRYS